MSKQMTPRRCALLLVCISFFPSTLFAQQEVEMDSLELDPVTVVATRFQVPNNRQPVKIISYDSTEISHYTGTGLSGILSDRGTTLIRNYGPGGLSTVSPRGYNPSRTQVLWNGFVLNDPLNGTVDFSLLPAAFIRRMELIPGNSSSAYGDRSAGGTVNLDSRIRERSISAWQALGSYGKNLQGGIGSWYSGNWHASLKFQREDSDNDFTYPLNGERETRSNNAVSSLNGMFEAGYTNSRFAYNTSLWMYDVENQSPGSLSFPSESAVQKDRSFRWIQRIFYTSGESDLEASLFYADNDQTYVDPSFGIDARNKNRQMSADLSWRYSGLNQLELTQVLSLARTTAESENYDDTPRQWVVSYQINPRLEISEKFQLFGGARYDYYETAGDAISGSVGFNSELLDQRLFFRGQASRNFVAPTFNDLFWVPSGNPDLDPETNRKLDLGLLYSVDTSEITLTNDLTFFASQQTDGILWIYNSDLGYSEVLNVDRIRTRGVELVSDYRQSLDAKTTLKAGLSITHNRSTVEEDQYEDDRTVGNQLIYVPEWQFSTRIGIETGILDTGVNIVWTGERFSSQDHASTVDPLDSYTASSAHLALSIPFQKTRLHLIGRAENLFDKEYQVINDYPMPGRHFTVTARVDISGR